MADPSFENILYQEQRAVATLTLNRPDALNSLTPPMLAEIRAVCDRIDAGKTIRALVLTGAGRGFCAGADLSAFDFTPGADMVQRANPEGTIERNFNPTLRRLVRLNVPTICAVNGVAAGAGASFVMACDIAIAAPGASFIQAFSKIGLIPDCGGTWLLPQRLGLARAMALAMTGDKLPAADAKAMGMIWDVADDALAAAQALAGRLAAMPTKALVATRAMLRDAHTRSLDEQLDMECAMQSKLGYTHDYIEGVQAFLEKRKPEFTGA